MPVTNAADLTAGQIAMVGTARYHYEHRTLCTKLFTRMNLKAGEKSLYIPKFGTITASDLTDGVDMTNSQQLTITGTTHTTDEAGCKVIITKKLRQQMKEDAYKAAGKVIGNAMLKKIDQDGLSLFSGLNTSVGSAGTSFSIDYLRAAISQCYGQAEPVPLPLQAVLHPFHYDEIVNEIATPSTNNFPQTTQDEYLSYYFRGTEKLFATPIYVTGNITLDASEDAYGAVFSKDTFIYLVGWEPENWLEEDKSLRGWEIGIVADYAMVEEDGTYGRALLFDAATPVS